MPRQKTGHFRGLKSPHTSRYKSGKLGIPKPREEVALARGHARDPDGLWCLGAISEQHPPQALYERLP